MEDRPLQRHIMKGLSNQIVCLTVRDIHRDLNALVVVEGGRGRGGGGEGGRGGGRESDSP